MLEFLTYHSYDSLSTNFPDIWNEETRRVKAHQQEQQEQQAVKGIVQAYDVIGLLKDTETHDSNENGSQDMDQYYLYLRGSLDIDAPVYLLHAANTYSDCYSGYCGATLGTFRNLVQIDEPSVFDYHPKQLLAVRFHKITNNGVVPMTGEFTDNMMGDCILLTLEGTMVAQCTGDGGDNYYPSGRAWVNLDLFEQVDV